MLSRAVGCLTVATAAMMVAACGDADTGTPAPNVCAPPSSEGGSPIDHITVAVGDLDDAVASVEAVGFTVKAGRRHANGIRNAHIKLKDGGSVELLSVDADATDELAAEYVETIRERPGGAFVALSATSAEGLEVAEATGVPPTVESGPAWDYVTFPVGSSLRHFYFIEMKQGVSDSDSVLSHANGATRLRAVEVSGGPSVESLLSATGAQECLRGTSWVWQLGGVDFKLASPIADSASVRIIVLGTGNEGSHRGEPQARVLLGGTTMYVY